MKKKQKKQQISNISPVLSFFRYFFATCGSTPSVTFPLLFRYSEFFGVSGSVGHSAPHKFKAGGWNLEPDSIISVHALSGPVQDTPHIAQYPFEIVSQRGVSHPFALFSKGITQVSLRYPLEEGEVSHLHFACSQAQKSGRGYRTQLAMLRHQKSDPEV